jgi:hypothetical protein
MLNAAPDTRNAADISEVSLAPNGEINSERRDDTEADARVPAHNTIDLDDRRNLRINSSNSEPSSSVEAPTRNSTVNIGKILL